MPALVGVNALGLARWNMPVLVDVNAPDQAAMEVMLVECMSRPPVGLCHLVGLRRIKPPLRSDVSARTRSGTRVGFLTS